MYHKTTKNHRKLLEEAKALLTERINDQYNVCVV